MNYNKIYILTQVANKLLLKGFKVEICVVNLNVTCSKRIATIRGIDSSERDSTLFFKHILGLRDIPNYIPSKNILRIIIKRLTKEIEKKFMSAYDSIQSLSDNLEVYHGVIY